jgi:hypothetical protein
MMMMSIHRKTGELCRKTGKMKEGESSKHVDRTELKWSVGAEPHRDLKQREGEEDHKAEWKGFELAIKAPD